MLEIIISALAIMLASLVGIISVWKKVGNLIERNLGFLVSVSSGVFLVIVFNLGFETVEHTGSIAQTFGLMIAGFLIVFFLFKSIPLFHHHHDDNNEEDSDHSSLDARKIMFSDSIHNIGDGILLSATFAISSSVGILAAFSILVHELVQEISEFFVLKGAGYSTYRALKINFLTSGTILIGVFGGHFLFEQFENLEIILLGLAGGGFLVVVVQDLIPHSIREGKRQNCIKRHILGFFIGIIIMGSLAYFVSH